MNEPLRSEYVETQVHTPWQPGAHQVGGSETHIVLPDIGGISTHRVDHIQSLHCGCCGVPPGGVCSRCLNVICERCYSRCLKCSMPIGPCCSKLIPDANGQLIPFCESCAGAVGRWQLLRFLLSPFVVFPD